MQKSPPRLGPSVPGLASLDCALHGVQHRFEIGTEDVLARLIESKIDYCELMEYLNFA